MDDLDCYEATARRCALVNLPHPARAEPAHNPVPADRDRIFRAERVHTTTIAATLGHDPRGAAARVAVMQVQPEVQRGDGVGERADREVVDAGLGVRAGVRQLQAAGGLEAGRGRCPAVGRPRRSSATVKLSSSTSSAPRASTSSSWSSVSTSTSHGRSGAWRRAAASAAPTEPAAATWLSLISTASPRPSRWLTPAAAAHGVLLQQPQAGQRLAGVADRGRPCPRRRRPRRRVAVATPERWQSRLSAVRSAVSRPRTGAADGEGDVARGNRSPSARGGEHRVAVGAEDGVQHGEGGGQPGQHARCAGGERGDRHRVGGHRGRGRGVGAVAQVLVERGFDDAAEVVGIGRAGGSRAGASRAGGRKVTLLPPGRLQGDIPAIRRRPRPSGPPVPAVRPGSCRTRPGARRDHRPGRRRRGAPRCSRAARRRRGRGSRCARGSPGSRCGCPPPRARPGRAA